MTPDEIKREYWRMENERLRVEAFHERVYMGCLAMERFLTFVWMEAEAQRYSELHRVDIHVARSHTLADVVVDRDYFTVEFP